MAQRKEAAEEDPTVCQLKFTSRRLDDMLNVKEFSDVTFLVEGSEVYASRVILAAASDYFKALLAGAGFREQQQTDKPIEMRGVDRTTFLVCLRFLYSGAVELSASNVLVVLRAADMYHIAPLCNVCSSKMEEMLDDTTWFTFLAAVDKIAGMDRMRTACLHHVRANPAAILADAVADELSLLSFSTMHALCSCIGCSEDAETSQLVDAWMQVLLTWGRTRWREERMTEMALYSKLRAMDYKSLVSEGLKPVAWTVTFKVTQGQLRKNHTLSSSVHAVDGFSFKVVLDTNDRVSSHIGLYLAPISRGSYADWWPCVVSWQNTTTSPAASASHTAHFNKAKYFQHSIAMGFAKYLAHVGIPDAPQDAGKLAADDVRLELEVVTEVIANPLLSLCMAYACRIAPLWERLSVCHLEGLLAEDSLPFASEDEVLKGLQASLSCCGQNERDLESLLKGVRWQFLSPGELLRLCRAPNSSAFRRCTVTKAALLWLIGQGDKPAWICERRRTTYEASVEDNRPLKQAVLVDCLLEEPEDDARVQEQAEELRRLGSFIQEEKARIQAAEARVQEAETRSQAAEARALAAEARALAAEERARVAEGQTREGRNCAALGDKVEAAVKSDGKEEEEDLASKRRKIGDP